MSQETVTSHNGVRKAHYIRQQGTDIAMLYLNAMRTDLQMPLRNTPCLFWALHSSPHQTLKLNNVKCQCLFVTPTFPHKMASKSQKPGMLLKSPLLA